MTRNTKAMIAAATSQATVTALALTFAFLNNEHPMAAGMHVASIGWTVTAGLFLSIVPGCIPALAIIVGTSETR